MDSTSPLTSHDSDAGVRRAVVGFS